VRLTLCSRDVPLRAICMLAAAAPNPAAAAHVVKFATRKFPPHSNDLNRSRRFPSDVHSTNEATSNDRAWPRLTEHSAKPTLTCNITATMRLVTVYITETTQYRADGPRTFLGRQEEVASGPSHHCAFPVCQVRFTMQLGLAVTGSQSQRTPPWGKAKKFFFFTAHRRIGAWNGKERRR